MLNTGTSRRLLLGFGLVIALFGLASVVAARGLSSVRETLGEVKVHEERVRTVLQLAGAVRDQYAHQAHTLLLGNTSHLPMYEESRARVAVLLGLLEAVPEDAETTRRLRDIRVASVAMDRVFRTEILPAVEAGDEGRAREAHDRALATVLAIARHADDLAAHFEGAISEFEREAARVQASTSRWAVGLLVGATVFAALVGAWIGRSVAGPLSRLGAGAARLAEGDLDTRLSVDGPEEFVRLADQLNAMTRAVKDQQAELVRSERLAGVGRLAAGVAHEINNPLGVILGYVRLLRSKADDPALQADLEVIAEETGRCRDIVEGLLDLARPWERGEETVDLGAVCEEIAARLSESETAAGVAIGVEGRAMVQGNRKALRQVLHNLLQNAADAAGEGGTVQVVVSQTGGGATVGVVDDGPGLGPEAAERLFEPFFTTKPDGTGLGLAVSQAIARAHGGEIVAEPVEHGGARFTLSLPGAVA